MYYKYYVKGQKNVFNNKNENVFNNSIYPMICHKLRHEKK